MRKFWNLNAANWRASILYPVSFIALGLFYTYQITSSLPLFSQAEINSRIAASSLHSIALHPVNAPYKILQYCLIRLGQNGLFAMRMVSVVLAVLAMMLFYYLILKWHTRRIAIIATFLLATNAVLVHTARTATPDVLLLAPLLVIAASLVVSKENTSKKTWILISVLLGLSLYVPYVIVFVLLGSLLQIKIIARSIKNLKPSTRTIGLLFFLVTLVPLVYGFYRQPSNTLEELVNIPSTFTSALDFFRQTLNVPLAFFIHSPNNPSVWLGRLPILDLFATVMFAFGIYAYAFKLKLRRAQLLLAVLVLGCFLIGFTNHWEYIILLLPFIYMTVAAGIALILQQWFTVFPLNPLARAAGTALLCMAVIMAGSYQIIKQYVAWPNNSQTKQVYSIKP